MEAREKIKSLRTQLFMSLECLSTRSNIDIETLKKIELGKAAISSEQLNQISKALFANQDLTPKKPVEEILAEQARLRATEIVRYVQGTMSLELQEPPKEYIEALIDSETEKLLTEERQLIWG